MLTALFRSLWSLNHTIEGGSLNSAVPHYWGTEVVPRDFDRTTAGPRPIDYRSIEGPLLYGTRAMEVQWRNNFVVGSENAEILGS